ncbi:hypothetical protein RZS08_06960, partial [Arthrospira platensis SPKY1]|nr:hypothetical protein [Arthrospira platensis SPKY1]
KENTVFYNFLNRLIYKLVYSIRNLKGYNKKEEEAQVNVIFWLFENNNHIEELNIIDKLLEYNENLLNNETGLLKDFYKNLIKKIIKASK